MTQCTDYVLIHSRSLPTIITLHNTQRLNTSTQYNTQHNIHHNAQNNAQRKHNTHTTQDKNTLQKHNKHTTYTTPTQHTQNPHNMHKTHIYPATSDTLGSHLIHESSLVFPERNQSDITSTNILRFGIYHKETPE